MSVKLTFDQLKDHVGKAVYVRAMGGQIIMTGTLSYYKHRNEFTVTIFTSHREHFGEITLKSTDRLWITHEHPDYHKGEEFVPDERLQVIID